MIDPRDLIVPFVIMLAALLISAITMLAAPELVSRDKTSIFRVSTNGTLITPPFVWYTNLGFYAVTNGVIYSVPTTTKLKYNIFLKRDGTNITTR